MRLEVDGLAAGYGAALVLDGVGFTLADGGVLVVAGPDGAGKSTLLKALMGLVATRAGRVTLGGAEVTSWPPGRRARAGLGYVPEERRVFAGLTVRENLAAGTQPPRPGADPWTLPRVAALFPPLAALAGRRAETLSGGEQQMLAIARTLMGNPRVLLLDEPMEGLAPRVARDLGQALAGLAAAGLGLLVAEQDPLVLAALRAPVLRLRAGRVS